jgi:hypothetical protein
MLRFIPSIPISSELLSWKVVEFCQRFFCIYWVDLLFFGFASVNICITFNDLHMLNHPYIPGMKPTWSWCMIFLKCCWISFANILLRIFSCRFHERDWPIILFFSFVLVQFSDECNTGFIEWVWQCSFLFCFVEKF